MFTFISSTVFDIATEVQWVSRCGTTMADNNAEQRMPVYTFNTFVPFVYTDNSALKMFLYFFIKKTKLRVCVRCHVGADSCYVKGRRPTVALIGF